jgi:hypothetical protein
MIIRFSLPVYKYTISPIGALLIFHIIVNLLFPNNIIYFLLTWFMVFLLEVVIYFGS